MSTKLYAVAAAAVVTLVAQAAALPANGGRLLARSDWADNGLFARMSETCTHGESRCPDGEHVQHCGSDGHWQTKVACPSHQTCANNRCQNSGEYRDPNRRVHFAKRDSQAGLTRRSEYRQLFARMSETCTHGESRCPDGEHVQHCGPDGHWQAKVACPSHQTCANNHCQNSGEYRDPNRRVHFAKRDSQAGLARRSESRQLFARMSETCTHGESRCPDGEHVQHCGSDGHWQTKVACPSHQTCANNRCQNSGEYRDPNRRVHFAKRDSQAGLARRSEYRELFARLSETCTHGESRCADGEHVQHCGADGHWQTKVACPSHQTCANNRCQNSGEYRDPNRRVHFAKRDSQAGLARRSEYRQLFARLSETCTHGESRCADGEHVQHCGSDGHWQTKVACPSHQTCANNRCQNSGEYRDPNRRVHFAKRGLADLD